MDPELDTFASRLASESEGLRRLARSLVADPFSADDLVQQGLLSAWTRRGSSIANPGAWLTGVLPRLAWKRRREEVRRARREAAVARPDVAPAADVLAERRETLRHVVDAVLALDRDQVDAVLLVYFEGLAPRAAAERMSIPEDTLRSRLRRALDLLRRRLDREHGGRGAWCAALVGAFGLEPPPVAPTVAPSVAPAATLTGGFLMSAAFKWSATVAAIALLAVSIRTMWPDSRSGADLSKDGPASVALAGTPVDTPPANTAPAERVEQAVAPAAAATSAEVAAAASPGPTYRGVVVDWLGNPVRGAEIRGDATADEASAAPLAISGEDGHVEWTGQSWADAVYARAAGYAPSLAERLQFLKPEGEIRFELPTPGYDVDGVVLDAGGAPVAEARVRVGRTYAVPAGAGDGMQRLVPAGQIVRCDALGRFRATGVPAGWTGVRVLARGLGFTKVEVEVGADLREPLVIELSPEARVRGVVRDSAGQPIAGAWIAMAADRNFGPKTQAAADGSFALAGLGSGSVDLEATSKAQGSIRNTLDLRPGDEREWNPVLARALALRGRVLAKPLDAGRSSLAGWRAHLAVANGKFVGQAVLSNDGRFEFAQCPPEPMVLSVYTADAKGEPFPVLIERGVRADDAELALELPEGWSERGGVEGRILRHDGQPADLHELSLHAASEQETWTPGVFVQPVALDPATGHFSFHGLPRGWYALRAMVDGLGRIDNVRFEIRDASVVQLDDIVLERPGELRAAITQDGAPRAERIHCEIVAPRGVPAQSYGRYPGRLPESIQLWPGRYALWVLPEGDAFSEWIEFEIRGGEAVALTVELETRKQVLVRVRDAPGRPAGDVLVLRVSPRHLLGREVEGSAVEIELQRGADGFERRIEVQPGIYDLSADAGEAGKLAAELYTYHDLGAEAVFQLE